MKRALSVLEDLLAWGGMRRDIVFLSLSAIALILSLLDLPGLPFDPAWVAILLCGIPILLEAFLGLVTAFDIKADLLVSLALIASVWIGEDFAAGEVAFIMQLGALLEDITVARARAGIEKLARLTPQTARVLAGGREKVVPAEQVQVGERLRVLPGESIPVDGVILTGQTSVDQSVMTGESMPVDKSPGDEVSSGTVNQFGAFEMRATRVGADSAIQRMIRLVQSADAGKARIVRLADRWATWVVVIALTAALLTGLLTRDIIRSVTILVVFCPCALVLATPTAIMAAIGNATRHGFLVREGDALERLATVSRVALDKTGTLTCGTPQVAAVHGLSEHWPEAAVYRLAAAAEQLSEHPLGKAVVHSYRQQYPGSPLPPASGFRLTPGRGVSATVDGHRVLAGNAEMLKDASLEPPRGQEPDRLLAEGCTLVYLAVDEQLAGCLALADALRQESADTVRQLRDCGVEPALLTGDNENAARAIASRLAIREVYAHCLPEDKLRHIQAWEKSGSGVCMIGDGINDAPALKAARVGIAMGGIGSDIAVEAADIALVNDEIRELPHLIALSRRMMRTIRLNLTFSMTLNFLAIALAIADVLNPVTGALVHNAGSVLVIINSALLLGWRAKKR